MEEYKLLDVENNILYFTHIIKTTTYDATKTQDLFDALPSFGLSDDINRLAVIFEINILKKRVDVLILQYQSNPHQTSTANKNTINEFDGILKRYLMKGVSKLSITYNLIDVINGKGKLTIDKAVGNLTGERSFVRKYRLNVDTIIVGYVKDKTTNKEPEFGFIEKKK